MLLPLPSLATAPTSPCYCLHLALHTHPLELLEIPRRRLMLLLQNYTTLLRQLLLRLTVADTTTGCSYHIHYYIRPLRPCTPREPSRAHARDYPSPPPTRRETARPRPGVGGGGARPGARYGSPWGGAVPRAGGSEGREAHIREVYNARSAREVLYAKSIIEVYCGRLGAKPLELALWLGRDQARG